MAQVSNGKTEPKFTGFDFEKAAIVYISDNDFFWFINKEAGQFVPRYSNYRGIPERSRQVLVSDKIYDDGERTLRPYFIAYNKALCCYCLYYMTASQKRGERYTGGFLEVPSSIYSSTFSCIGGVRQDNHYHDETSYPAIDYNVCVPVPVDMLNTTRLRAPYTGIDAKAVTFSRQFFVHPELKKPTKNVMSGKSMVWFRQKENGMHLGDKEINPSVSYLALVQNYLVALAGRAVADTSLKAEEYYRGAAKLLSLVSDELVKYCDSPLENHNKSVDERVIKAAADWLSESRENISCTPTSTELLSCLMGGSENDYKKLTSLIVAANANFARKAERANQKAIKLKETISTKAKTKQEQERIRAKQRAEDEKTQKEAETATKKLINRAVLLFNELYFDASKTEGSAVDGLSGRVKEFATVVRDGSKKVKEYRAKIAGGEDANTLLAAGKDQEHIVVADMRNSFGSDEAFVKSLNNMAESVSAANIAMITDDNGKATEELFGIISKIKPLTKTNAELVQRVYEELGTKRTKLTPEIVRCIDLGGANTARAKMDVELGKKAMLETATAAMTKEYFYGELKRLVEIFAQPMPAIMGEGNEVTTDIFTARDNIIKKYDEYYEDFFTAEQYNRFESGADIKQKAIQQALQIAKDGVKNKEDYAAILNKVKNHFLGVAGKVRTDVENINGYLAKFEQLDAKCVRYCKRFDALMSAISVMQERNGDGNNGVAGLFVVNDYLSLPLEKKFPHMDKVIPEEREEMVKAVNWVSDILKDLSDRIVPFGKSCFSVPYTGKEDMKSIKDQDKPAVESEINELYYVLNALSFAFCPPKELIEGGIDSVHENGKKTKANVTALLAGADKELEKLDNVYKSLKSVLNSYNVAMEVKTNINKLYDAFNRVFVEPEGAEKAKFAIDIFKVPLSEMDIDDGTGKLMVNADWFGAAKDGIKAYIDGVFVPYFVDSFPDFMLQGNSSSGANKKERDRIRKLTQNGTRFFVDSNRGSGEPSGKQVDLNGYLKEMIAYLGFIEKASDLVYRTSKGDKGAANELKRKLDKVLSSEKFNDTSGASVLKDIFRQDGSVDTDDKKTRAGLAKLLLAFSNGVGDGTVYDFGAGIVHLMTIAKKHRYSSDNSAGLGEYRKSGTQKCMLDLPEGAEFPADLV